MPPPAPQDGLFEWDDPWGLSAGTVISSPPPSSTALPLPRSGFVEPFLLPRRLPFISYFVLSKMSVLRMIHQEKNPFS